MRAYFLCFLICFFSLIGVAHTAEKTVDPIQIDWKKKWYENYDRAGSALLKGDYKTLDSYFNGLQKSFESGLIDEDMLVWEFKVFRDTIDHQPSHKYIENWAKSSPDSYAANLVAGRMHLNYAWDLRGNKFANKTSAAQFAGFDREVSKAAQYFLKSLSLAEQPVLSYVGILGTFHAPSAALSVYRPQIVEAKKEAPKSQQTVGDALKKALGDIAKGISGPVTDRYAYSYEDLHEAMWYYAFQGMVRVPQSELIVQSYFVLLKEQWFGNEEMSRGVADYFLKRNMISQATYNYLLSGIMLDRVVYYYDKDGPNYDPQKIADLYLEAVQYLDEKENRVHYYAYIYWYLQASYDLYLANGMTVEREKKLLPIMDHFIESSTNPYRLRTDDKEYNAGYAHVLDLRAYVRMVHQKNAKGAWADLNESYARGSAYAAYKVASTYCQGYLDLVPQDRNKCVAIMKESARLGHQDAKDALTRWGEKW